MISISPLAAKGILPGGNIPSTIELGHDVLSLAELSSTIFQLGEDLILQRGDARWLNNASVDAAERNSADQPLGINSNFTVRQTKSIKRALRSEVASQLLPLSFRGNLQVGDKSRSLASGAGNDIGIQEAL
jgi:hypothetical protein